MYLFWCVFSGYIYTQERSYGSSIFSFFKEAPQYHTNLHSKQQCMKVLFSPQPLQYLFLMTAIPTGELSHCGSDLHFANN